MQVTYNLPVRPSPTMKHSSLLLARSIYLEMDDFMLCWEEALSLGQINTKAIKNFLKAKFSSDLLKNPSMTIVR